MIAGPGQSDQPLALVVNADLSVGDLLRQHGGEFLGKLSRERVELNLRRVSVRLGRLQLFQHGLDRPLGTGTGHGDQASSLRVDRQFGIGQQALKRCERRRGIGFGQRIDFQLRCLVERCPVSQMSECCA